MDDEKLIEAVMAEIERIEYQQYPEHIARAVLAVICPAVIEECARVCDELRHPDWSCESGAWVDGTDACAAAIRTLAAPRVEQEKKP